MGGMILLTPPLTSYLATQLHTAWGPCFSSRKHVKAPPALQTNVHHASHRAAQREAKGSSYPTPSEDEAAAAIARHESQQQQQQQQAELQTPQQEEVPSRAELEHVHCFIGRPRSKASSPTVAMCFMLATANMGSKLDRLCSLFIRLSSPPRCVDARRATLIIGRWWQRS